MFVKVHTFSNWL